MLDFFVYKLFLLLLVDLICRVFDLHIWCQGWHSCLKMPLDQLTKNHCHWHHSELRARLRLYFLRIFLQLKNVVLAPYEDLAILLSKYWQFHLECYCVWLKRISLSCIFPLFIHKIQRLWAVPNHSKYGLNPKIIALVRTYPSFLYNSVVSQFDTPFSWFILFDLIFCSLKLDLIFCSCSLFRSCLANLILFVIASDLSSTSYCRVWLMIFAQSRSVSFTGFSSSTWQDSVNSGMFSPPHLGGSESNFLFAASYSSSDG